MLRPIATWKRVARELGDSLYRVHEVTLRTDRRVGKLNDGTTKRTSDKESALCMYMERVFLSFVGRKKINEKITGLGASDQQSTEGRESFDWSVP